MAHRSGHPAVVSLAGVGYADIVLFLIALALLVAMILAIAVLTALTDAVAGPAAERSASPPRRTVAPDRRPPDAHAVGSMVFATVDDDGITLDCLLTEGDDEATGGGDRPVARPVTLHLRRPATAWFSSCVEDVLRQWAAEDRVVAIDVRHGRGDRAEVSDGRSRIILDLDHVDA